MPVMLLSHFFFFFINWSISLERNPTRFMKFKLLFWSLLSHFSILLSSSCLQIYEVKQQSSLFFLGDTVYGLFFKSAVLAMLPKDS